MGPASPTGSASTSAAAAEVTALINQLEPRLATPLQERFGELMDELASVRTRVRAQHERNTQLQRETEEHARLLKKLAEVELQNRLFEDRFEEEDVMTQAAIRRVSQASREIQERTRMG